MPKKVPDKKIPRKWSPIPTRVTVETQQEGGPGPGEEIPIDPPAAIQDSDVEDILSSLEQDSRIELWRWSDQMQDWAYVGRYPPQGFSLDMVQKAKGSGKYRIVIRGPSDDNPQKLVIRGKRVFTVEGDARPATNGNGAVGEGMAELIKLQGDMLRQHMNQPRESMTDVVRAVAELMKPAAALPAPAGIMGGMSIKDILEAVRTVKDLTAGGEKTSMGELMDLLATAREMVGGGEDGSNSPVTKALDVIGKAMENAGREDRKPPMVLLRPDTPPPFNPPAATPAPAPAPAGGGVQLVSFTEVAGIVLGNAARKNADIDLYAEWVIDQLPPAIDQQLDVWMQDPTFPNMLLSWFPDVAPQWLRAVFLKVREMLMEDDEGEDNDGKTGTVVGHVAPAPDGGRGNGVDDSGNGPIRQ